MGNVEIVREDKPTISVITIVFNGEKHIEQAISSVLNQTYGNIEYIVAATDRTLGMSDLLRIAESAR